MSYDLVQENVPDFVRRVGDHVLQGSNNTILIFGTDRAKKGPAGIGDGLGHIKAPGKGKGTGTFHIIAGRKGPNPDLISDDSYLYLSQKTDIDPNLGLESVEKSRKGVPAAILKSDSVRVVYREDLKVCLTDGKNYLFMDREKVTIKIGTNVIEMDGGKCKIEVGATKAKLDGSVIDLTNGAVNINASSSLVKVKSPQLKISGGCEVPWDTLLQALMKGLAGHTHMTAVGPATPMVAAVGPGDSEGPALAGLYAAWKSQSTGS